MMYEKVLQPDVAAKKLTLFLTLLVIGNGGVTMAADEHMACNAGPVIDFDPPIEVEVIEGQLARVHFRLQWNKTRMSDVLIQVGMEPSLQAQVVGNSSYYVSTEADDDWHNGINRTVTLKGLFLGHAKLVFFCQEAGDANITVPTAGSNTATTATTTTTTAASKGINDTAISKSVTAAAAAVITKIPTNANQTIPTNGTATFEMVVTLPDATVRPTTMHAMPTTITTIMPQMVTSNVPTTTTTMIDTDEFDTFDEDMTTLGPAKKNRSRSSDYVTVAPKRRSRREMVANNVKNKDKRLTEKASTTSQKTSSKVKPASKNLDVPKRVLSDTYRVRVIRGKGVLDAIFMIFIGVFVTINLVMMGCQVELPVVIGVLKKPIGPAVGFVCQFGFMPLISYSIGQLLLQESNLQLGLFTLGCSPGGNGSNFFTLLLHGDLNLSITMTFISTMCAIFMTPLWMFTLGQKILTKGNIVIPFVSLLVSMASFCVPVLIGVAIQHYRPEWAKIAKKIIRPFTIFLIISFNVLGYFTSQYMITLMTWRILLAGVCVAWSGYAFGAAFAWICRMPRPQIVAVSLETAIQNGGIAFMVLGLTLQQPDADLSSIAPVAQLMVTGTPLLIGYTVVTLYRKLRRCLLCGKSSNGVDVVVVDNDIDTMEPLVINRTSTVPSPTHAAAKDHAVGNGANMGSAVQKNNSAAVVCANMYNDYDEQYYDKAYSRPRIELKLSYDPQAKYDVPKSNKKMRTFEDDFSESTAIPERTNAAES